MADSSRYQKGQRWRFKPPVDAFEDTLVIGWVMEWEGRNYKRLRPLWPGRKSVVARRI